MPDYKKVSVSKCGRRSLGRCQITVSLFSFNRWIYSRNYKIQDSIFSMKTCKKFKYSSCLIFSRVAMVSHGVISIKSISSLLITRQNQVFKKWLRQDASDIILLNLNPWHTKRDEIIRKSQNFDKSGPTHRFELYFWPKANRYLLNSKGSKWVAYDK